MLVLWSEFFNCTKMVHRWETARNHGNVQRQKRLIKGTASTRGHAEDGLSSASPISLVFSFTHQRFGVINEISLLGVGNVKLDKATLTKLIIYSRYISSP